MAQETADVFVVLLEISHSDLAEPIRISGDAQDVTHLTNVYTRYPFTISLPTDEQDSTPVAQIEIDNVSQTITASLRGLSSPPSFALKVIRTAAPDVVEVEWSDFELKAVGYDALTITGALTVESFLVEPYPAGKFLPTEFKALFS